jgi:DNA-directed RNA polymerase specialized sigma24 family protein
VSIDACAQNGIESRHAARYSPGVPDLFPSTARTWISEQFATIELGGVDADTARERLRSHVMEHYARPLAAYVRATSIARTLSLDADDVVHDFLAHRVSRAGFFERYAESGLPLRRYLMNGVFFLLRERLADRAARGGNDLAELAALETRVSPRADLVFERAWAESMLELAADHVAQELEASGDGTAWEIYRRHFIDGASYDEIARVMSLGSADIRNEIRRAGRRLERMLLAILRAEGIPESDAEAELRRILDRTSD